MGNPLDAGAVQLNCTLAFAAIPVTTGTLGAFAIINGFAAPAGDVPVGPVAVTEIVYDVPGVRPEIVAELPTTFVGITAPTGAAGDTERLQC